MDSWAAEQREGEKEALSRPVMANRNLTQATNVTQNFLVAILKKKKSKKK